MVMDLRKIRKLIEIFNVSNLSEIEIHEGDDSIRLTRTLTVVSDATTQPVVHVPAQASPSLGEIDIEEDAGIDENHFSVLSPMVGTFFCAATPTDEPFVTVGDEVSVGQPLCLIEAMKIFNQIEAERSGTIVKILKENGDPVEYGEPMFVLSE